MPSCKLHITNPSCILPIIDYARHFCVSGSIICDSPIPSGATLLTEDVKSSDMLVTLTALDNFGSEYGRTSLKIKVKNN